jgi:ribosome assembly protein YihI (activator of Der GTPase)
MEAAVAERELEMTEWNDGRLDELSKRVDDGFAEMREEFRLVDSRFNSLHQLLIRMAWTYGIGMLAFAGALLGIIATKL